MGQTEKSNSLFSKDTITQVIIFLLLILPVIVLAFFSYQKTNEDVTNTIIARKASIASLSSAILKEKFDRLQDVGISFSTRVQFKNLVKAGKWNEAIAIASTAPRDFSYIEAVNITDPNGVQKATTSMDKSTIGTDFSYRDWYKGVSKDWQPYVSEVFKRATKPQQNIIALAVPIKDDSPDKKVVGILVFQIKLETIFAWSKEVDIGPSGFVYIVDKNGHIAAHPGYSPQGAIVDYSNVSVVKKSMMGKRGVEVLYNTIEREERLVAYEQLPHYGWSVFVTQPVHIAFADRDENLQFISLVDAFVFILNAALAYLILLIFRKLKNSERELRNNREFLDSIIENIPHMIFVKDAKALRFVRFNRAGEELLGISRASMMGKNDYDFFSTEQADFFTSKDKQVLQNKKILDIPEETIDTKDKGKRILHTKKIPIFDKDGTPVYLLGISEDITARKQEEMHMQEQTRDLERLNKLMINRELKMVELKKENEQLKEQLIKK